MRPGDTLLATSSRTYVVNLTTWGRIKVLFGFPVIVHVHTDVAKNEDGANETTVSVSIYA